MDTDLSQAVVVACGRSPVAKAMKGALKDTHPVDYAAQVLRGVLARLPQLDPMDIDDVIIGTARPEQKMGSNMARLIAVRAGLPYEVPAQTINRFCSSGLQAVATAANAIRAGQAEVMVAGGVEMMNKELMGFPEAHMNPWLAEHESACYMPMGITAENVAARYSITRSRSDAFSAQSHRRAAAAQRAGKFQGEIIPIQPVAPDGGAALFTRDEGIRPDTTPEGLAALKPAFLEGGVVTAGSSSQMSDGAGMVVLMSLGKALSLGLTPAARFAGFAVGGVDPAYMGIGPIAAVPKVLRLTGLSLDQMDVIELNEAFATQALACIDTLGMDPAKVNPNGGAIALGHPMGATGAILTCKALSELRRTGGRYGLVTMCIGGGMGAAGIYELL